MANRSSLNLELKLRPEAENRTERRTGIIGGTAADIFSIKKIADRQLGGYRPQGKNVLPGIAQGQVHQSMGGNRLVVLRVTVAPARIFENRSNFQISQGLNSIRKCNFYWLVKEQATLYLLLYRPGQRSNNDTTPFVMQLYKNYL